MGYTTRFSGRYTVSPALRAEHLGYLLQFARTRRVRRDAARTAERPDPLRSATGLPVGEDGAFFVGAGGDLGQEGGGPTGDPLQKWWHERPELGIADYNEPPEGQPHFWCCWEPTPDGAGIHCPDSGYHYEYATWLAYLITHFLGPWGYRITGELRYEGDSPGDRGLLLCSENAVSRKPEGALGMSGEGMAGLERAVKYFNDKRYEQALRLAADAAQRAPDWPEAWWQKGIALGALGRKEEAWPCLERAIQADADAATRRQRRQIRQRVFRSEGLGSEGLDLVRKLRSAERFAEALEEGEAYVAAVPEGSRGAQELCTGWVNVALCRWGMGDHGAALASLKQAIASDPTDDLPWSKTAYLLADHLSRPEEAILAFDNALKLGGIDGKLCNRLGMLLSGLGRKRESLSAFLRAVAHNPADATPWFNCGLIYTDFDAATALLCFEKALALGNPEISGPAAQWAARTRSSAAPQGDINNEDQSRLMALKTLIVPLDGRSDLTRNGALRDKNYDVISADTATLVYLYHEAEGLKWMLAYSSESLMPKSETNTLFTEISVRQFLQEALAEPHGRGALLDGGLPQALRLTKEDVLRLLSR